ncbi:hypothetical protein VKT23_017536 [Stygiomarasmius scandens]|uniref:RNA polymerase II-associated protein 1 C-terminal domain-containing protein n=1 Tax=Marasmiellus scandens TaxID=2682957 RepID=A0ABR1IVV7_9AGAR
MNSNNLIGSVFERKPTGTPSAPSSASKPTSMLGKHGFPIAQHRSIVKSAGITKGNERKSAFQKAREESRRNASARLGEPLKIGTQTRLELEPEELPHKSPSWRTQISSENQERVSSMSAEEREREKQEIIERFGKDVGDILRRAREKREKEEREEEMRKSRKESEGMQAVELTNEEEDTAPATPLKSKPSLHIAATTPSTRTSSPTPSARKLRFAELKPSNVHVYESAPPSPRKKALALPPPEEGEGGNAVIKLGDLGAPKVKMVQAEAKEEEPEEGTPEYIQKKFFPSQPRPRDVPELAWTSSSPSPIPTIKDTSPQSTLPSSLSQLRFSLTGHPISPSLSLKLPTHLGLHHHSEGIHAGYTLDDVFLLSRSTVRMQRAGMLSVLRGVVQVIRGDVVKGNSASLTLKSKPKPNGKNDSTNKIDSDIGYESDPDLVFLLKTLRSPAVAKEILKRVLFTGLEAMVEKGVVGVRGVELVWEVLCGSEEEKEKEEDWEEFVSDLGGSSFESEAMEEKTEQLRTSLISSLPLSQILPQFVNVLSEPPDRAVDDALPKTATQEQASSSTPTLTQTYILSILLILISFPSSSNRSANQVAEEVCKTKGLVKTVFGVFVVSSFASPLDYRYGNSTLPPTTSAPPHSSPDPKALSLLISLAQASRENARILVEESGVPDLLLRFVFGIAGSLIMTANSESREESEGVERPDQRENLLQAQEIQILGQIFHFYATLSKYGMYTHIAADAKEVWWKLGKWGEDFVRSLTFSSSKSRSRYQWILLKSFSSLIETWLVASTDPHQTTPPHALVWSVVESLGWGEWVLGIVQVFVSQWTLFCEEKEDSNSDPAALDVFGALLRALAAWIEGARVNGVRGGEDVRKRVGESASLMLPVAEALLKRINKKLEVEAEGDKTMKRRERSSLLRVAKTSWILGSVIRVLVGVGVDIDVGAKDNILTSLTSGLLNRVVGGVVKLLAAGFASSSTSLALAARPMSCFLVWYLRSLEDVLRATTGTLEKTETGVEYAATATFDPLVSSSTWLSHAFSILPVLQPGDEDAALDTLKAIFLRSGSAQGIDLEVIRPFYEYEILGGKTASSTIKRGDTGSEVPERDEGEIAAEEGDLIHVSISPLSPTPKSISSSSTQRVLVTIKAGDLTPSSSEQPIDTNSASGMGHNMKRKEWGPTGLPLGASWIFRPVDHLLRSGNRNSVFKNLGRLSKSGLIPKGWNPSEVEIVRAVLVVGVSVIDSQMNTSKGVSMSMEEAVFGCMKVFMLEHEQEMENPQEGMGEEVFRDTMVEKLMGELVRPFTAGEKFKLKSLYSMSATLEETSLPFLGPSNTPFYQFYTDLVGLYDAISFSHPLFGKILLPPTSMKYAIDYRRLLWCDYPHIIRNLRVPIEQAIVGNTVEEWLWPLENDTRMLGAYIGVLIRYGVAVDGFLRWIAVHHVAGNIWEDVGPEEFNENRKDRARKLLKTIVQQGTRDIVTEVLRYRQKDGILMPPACFATDTGEWKENRKAFLNELVITDTSELAKLLDG